ncbi:phasin family protein [Stakelama sp. CBK3Z-3]|uniref:Phasin family protein n=1 Tax=Stakelama flava TaxID=2860338 RepID=A0ABS6XK81_9SPHN|nr:phasin family protein [Stakelama flava]MBW4330334.1 phasin family protein [Stakelama flava]
MANNSAKQAGEEAADRMQAAGSTMMETGSQLGVKMLDQAETNTQEAFKAMRAAAQAKDISEVMRIQSDFMREQGGRSVSQAREIGEMIANMGRSTIGQMTGKK